MNLNLKEKQISVPQFGLLSPEKLLDWKNKRGILHVPIIPKTVILCPQLGILKKKQRLFGQKNIKGLQGIHLCLNPKSGLYLSSGWGIGAAGLITLCEELRVLGVETFYFLGIAGRLTPVFTEGSIGLAEKALCEEGTSTHYHLTDKTVAFRINSTDRIYENFKNRGCTVVSTDAPFRETADKIASWTLMGADLVDMETSALYSFASFYQINALSLVVAADSLFSNEWTMVSNYSTIEVIQMRTLNQLIELLNP